MTSICPDCRQPTPLLNGVWVCDTCWKSWRAGPSMRRYLPERVGYDRTAWDALSRMLTTNDEE